jgi:diaminohydroxyphosphoribosylaminopyrimidine deaminase/5-amino-6-(5-phosphoribosylamino)uracil reductase
MSTSAPDADDRFMGRALELAAGGWGRVHPNPLVGAVVVLNGQVVGEGAHREFGGPHAEVEALEAAGARSRGATLYVTLEPCAHHGKTPPCTNAILEHGVRRLVYAASDPNPEASGGAAWLARHGVEVVGGVGRDRARRQNALFIHAIEAGRPFLALKFGMTLDARIAGKAGERTAITSAESQAEVHRLRSGFDAVLVGGETARVDDPELTVRHAAAPRVPPVRLVMDPMARLSPESRLARTAARVPVRVLVAPDAPGERVTALRRAGVDVVAVPRARAGLDLDASMEALWESGIRTIFCEGGGRLAASLLAGGQVRRLYLFVAPVVFGGGGVPAFPGDSVFRGERPEVRQLGPDTLLTIDRSA